MALQVADGHGYTYPGPSPSNLLDVSDSSLTDALTQYEAEGRTSAGQPGQPATYPIWGYPVLLSLLLSLGLNLFSGILIIQFILCIASVALAYRTFALDERLWHLPLLFPWLMMFSVRWPDAIVAFLLCLILFLLHCFSKQQRLTPVIAAALYLGLLFNFRPEYIAFALTIPVALFICRNTLSHTGRFGIVMPSVILVALSLACYIPWIAHSSYDGTLRWAPTNAGAVLYISLGQLPDNPWHRQHNDLHAYAVARARGLQDAMGPEADTILKAQFRRDIAGHPGAFARKVWHNFRSTIDGRIDGGEFRPGDPGPTATARIRRSLARPLGPFASASASTYRWVYRFGEFILLATLITPGLRRRLPAADRFLLWSILLLVAVKVLVHSLTQYEPRHFMPLWLPLVFVALVHTKPLWQAAAGRWRAR